MRRDVNIFKTHLKKKMNQYRDKEELQDPERGSCVVPTGLSLWRNSVTVPVLAIPSWLMESKRK